MREKVSLVLYRVRRAVYPEQTILIIGHYGIMTRSHLVQSFSHPVEKGAEFDAAVAEDVRTGCPSVFELGNGIGHHPLPVFPLEADHLERHSRHITSASGILQVLFPGTGTQRCQLIFQPDLQIISGNLRLRMILLQRNQRRRTVDAPG